MSLGNSLINTIISFIANKQVQKLEKAFRKSPDVVGAIQNMHRAYEKMERNLDDFCEKYPTACEEAKRKRKERGLDL